MDKEFVTYEQAKELFDMGLRVPIAIRGYTYQYNEMILTDNLYDGLYTLEAPLKSQAFRWFREKYFLDCEIYLQEELGHKFYHYLVLQLVRGNIEWKSKNTIKFKTYEEAENACIDKLIEIVKQQDVSQGEYDNIQAGN
jgi:hypothetical protein